jgi:hypothetical protein
MATQTLTAALEAADEKLSKLLTDAHDIKSMLGGVHGLLEVADDSTDDVAHAQNLLWLARERVTVLHGQIDRLGVDVAGSLQKGSRTAPVPIHPTPQAEAAPVEFEDEERASIRGMSTSGLIEEACAHGQAASDAVSNAMILLGLLTKKFANLDGFKADGSMTEKFEIEATLSAMKTQASVDAGRATSLIFCIGELAIRLQKLEAANG